MQTVTKEFHDHIAILRLNGGPANPISSTMVDAVVLSPVLFLFSLILAKLSTSMGRRDKGVFLNWLGVSYSTPRRGDKYSFFQGDPRI